MSRYTCLSQIWTPKCLSLPYLTPRSPTASVKRNMLVYVGCYWAMCRLLTATGCAQSRFRTTTTAVVLSGRVPTTVTSSRTGAPTCHHTATTSTPANNCSFPLVSIIVFALFFNSFISINCLTVPRFDSSCSGLGGAAVRTSDFRSGGRGFDSRPGRNQVT